MTVTVRAATRMSTGVWAWVMPMPRWCSRLPWRRVSLPNLSTVSWRMRRCALGWLRGVGFGSGVVGVVGGGVAGVGAVGPLGVVDGGEGVEQGLQLGQGGWSWSGGEPAFEGLVEAFDFALGLWVVGLAVFLGDAQGG